MCFFLSCFGSALFGKFSQTLLLRDSELVKAFFLLIPVLNVVKNLFFVDVWHAVVLCELLREEGLAAARLA